jgi:hypothetical protein
MKVIMFIILGAVVVTMLIAPVAKACTCNCAVLQACYADCKRLMPDPNTTMFCDGGCLIACIYHGDA